MAPSYMGDGADDSETVMSPPSKSVLDDNAIDDDDDNAMDNLKTLMPPPPLKTVVPPPPPKTVMPPPSHAPTITPQKATPWTTHSFDPMILASVYGLYGGMVPGGMNPVGMNPVGMSPIGMNQVGMTPAGWLQRGVAPTAMITPPYGIAGNGTRGLPPLSFFNNPKSSGGLFVMPDPSILAQTKMAKRTLARAGKEAVNKNQKQGTIKFPPKKKKKQGKTKAKSKSEMTKAEAKAAAKARKQATLLHWKIKIDNSARMRLNEKVEEGKA